MALISNTNGDSLEIAVPLVSTDSNISILEGRKSTLPLEFTGPRNHLGVSMETLLCDLLRG